MTEWNDVWQRLAQHRHVVALGTGTVPAPEPHRVAALVVDCAFVSGPGACLEEIRRRVEALAGDDPQARLGNVLARVRWGVRRHLLSESQGDMEPERTLEALGRLSDTDPPTALVLRSVDRADTSSLEQLTGLVARRLELPISILFCFEAAAPTGSAGKLLSTLRARLDPEGFFEPRPAPQPEGAPAPLLSRLESLPDETRNLLRAAATLGEQFESEVLAELLEVDELDVLIHLQRAVDAGLDIEDREQGRFCWSPELVQALKKQTLPSLVNAWHHRLSQLFGGTPSPDAEGPTTFVGPAPTSEPVGAPARPSTHTDSTAAPKASPQVPKPEQLFERNVEHTPATGELDDDWERALAELSPERAREVRSKRAGGVPHSRSEQREVRFERADSLRAASHAAAAGDVLAAAKNYVVSAEQSASAGHHEAALGQAERGLELLARLPNSGARRAAQVDALLVIANSRWLSVGRGSDTTLEAALEPLDVAKPLLRDARDAPTMTRLAALYANICYDIGTPQSLERALRELTQTAKQLLDWNQPLLAAELLNDEAAIWVRIGDPVRAHHLLDRSREVFGRVVTTHPSALRELAETEHMMARLVLHARARAGREDDATRLGIEHALSSEEGYQSLGDQRQLARVRETLGRLETRLEHFDRALRYLSQARDAQLELGDAVGLARSSAALSEAFAHRGAPDRALDELRESVRLNVRKGSLVGLRFNLEALHRLLPGLPPELAEATASLEGELQHLLAASYR